MKKSKFTVAAIAMVLAAPMTAARAHDAGHFSAGEPGDPKKPARVVKVVMREEGSKEGTKMLFEPTQISVRKGEQIRFVLENDGTESHEFVLATVAENRKHAKLMKKYPHMEHDDPNAKRLTPFTEGEIVWKFTKRGTFEYACLIPGHLEAGMHGTIHVK
jgi:uncharacterized cupredoxin-like copper-binding protein